MTTNHQHKAVYVEGAWFCISCVTEMNTINITQREGK